MTLRHFSIARHILAYPMMRFGIILLLPLFLTQCETTKTGKTGSYKSASYGSDRIATPSGHGMRKSEYPFDDDGTYRRDWVRDESRDRAGNSYPSTAIASTGSGSRSSSARSNSGDGGASSRSEVASRRKPKSGSPGSRSSAEPAMVEPESADSTEFASYFGPGGQGTSSPSSAAAVSPMSGPSSYAPSAATSTPPPTLVSYTPASTPAPPAVAPSPAPAPSVTYHKVASGDTLYSLSRRYGSSVAEIKRINGLSSDTIRVGQSLRLP